MSKKYGNITEQQENLLNAVEIGDLQEVKRIIKGGVSPNFEINDGYAFSPIYLAILKKHFDIVIWLMDKGGVKPTIKIHHWAAVVVGDISISNAIYERIKN